MYVYGGYDGNAYLDDLTALQLSSKWLSVLNITLFTCEI